MSQSHICTPCATRIYMARAHMLACMYESHRVPISSNNKYIKDYCSAIVVQYSFFFYGPQTEHKPLDLIDTRPFTPYFSFSFPFLVWHLAMVVCMTRLNLIHERKEERYVAFIRAVFVIETHRKRVGSLQRVAFYRWHATHIEI